MEIIKLEDSDNLVFEKICLWYYNWLGIKNGESLEEVKCTFFHSLNKDKLPQIYVALINGEPAGMYQLSMFDDLNCRPDIYPWLINVYVDEKFRGKNVCRKLMQTVKDNAKKANLKELYLYTKHVGLYEKFGWEFVEEVKTFKKDSQLERLYKLKIN